MARSARRPQVEILAENPYIFCLISRLDPLERLSCDGLVLQLPARCPAAGRSEDVFQYTEEEVDTLQRWSEMRLELKFS